MVLHTHGTPKKPSSSSQSSPLVVHRHVEDEQALRRDLAQQRLRPRGRPDVARVTEHPPLHDPRRLRAGVRDGAKDVFPAEGQPRERLRLGLPRQGHLIEAIGQIILAHAELLLPLLHEEPPDLPEERLIRREEPPVEVRPLHLQQLRLRAHARQRLRHEARESRHDRLHPQLPHPAEHRVLQRHRTLQPHLRHRRVGPLAQIAHPHPRQVRRADHPRQDFLLRQPQARQRAHQDGLVGDDGHRHIDAVERHPVDLPHPPRLVPIRRRVAEGNHVHVLVMQERRHHPDILRRREGRLRIKTVPRPRADGRALPLRVHVKGLAERHRRTAAQRPAIPRDLIGRPPPLRRDGLQRQPLRHLLPRETGDHRPRSLGGSLREPDARQRARRQQCQCRLHGITLTNATPFGNHRDEPRRIGRRGEGRVGAGFRKDAAAPGHLGANAGHVRALPRRVPRLQGKPLGGRGKETWRLVRGGSAAEARGGGWVGFREDAGAPGHIGANAGHIRALPRRVPRLQGKPLAAKARWISRRGGET